MAVVATGFFDGVHLGHRKVIETLVRTARLRGEESLVITFWPHPRTVLQNDARSLRLITSLDEKKSLLFSLGVDRVEVLPFSKDFAAMTAASYLQMLKSVYNAGALVLGYDNRFGSDGRKTSEIVALAGEMALEAFVVPACDDVLYSGGTAVSSTMIRRAIADGDAASAAAMLGRPYMLHGVVVAGKQLGRTIGFPTANMQMYEPLKIIPARGAYLTKVVVLGKEYDGMTNVGDIVETHILGFDEDIYGLDIILRFVSRIRDEKRFGSVDELKSQLEEDKRNILLYLR